LYRLAPIERADTNARDAVGNGNVVYLPRIAERLSTDTGDRQPVDRFGDCNCANIAVVCRDRDLPLAISYVYGV